MVIKLDAIGDFIIWLDSAKEYKKLYQTQEVNLLCSDACKELACISGYFDKVYSLDPEKFMFNQEYRKLKQEELITLKCSVLIQTAFSRTQLMDIIAARIPANKKIGFVADESKSNISRKLETPKRKKMLDGIYDQLIPASKKQLMELNRNKEFLLGLGDREFRSSIPKLPRIELVYTPKEDYFLVFPGASSNLKMWDIKNYSIVIDYVLEKRDWTCLICGGQKEKNIYLKLEKLVKHNHKLKDYTGKTSLVELIEYVRNAKFVLSNDTSGIHFAAATNTPGICPFGEYNYGRFLPYISDNGVSKVRVVSANMKCRNCSQRKMN
ncbi:glycosyltransferase family 9 protein, partial [Succinivibrio sp.]|uniref:glycosyltransferase family 9 protein n=1 Tax=Succinivibrio sp. TaxID=2053619 RepID=UPI0025878F41